MASNSGGYDDESGCALVVAGCFDRFRNVQPQSAYISSVLRKGRRGGGGRIVSWECPASRSCLSLEANEAGSRLQLVIAWCAVKTQEPAPVSIRCPTSHAGSVGQPSGRSPVPAGPQAVPGDRRVPIGQTSPVIWSGPRNPFLSDDELTCTNPAQLPGLPGRSASTTESGPPLTRNQQPIIRL